MSAEKEAARVHFRALRRAKTDRAVAGQAIYTACRELLAEVESVFIYESVNSEPDTRELIEWLRERGVRVYVPELTGPGLMRARALSQAAPELPDSAVAVIPGLAFDYSGGRLGQGGGYYDRFLARHRELFRVGICFDELLVPQLPTERADVPMDIIVTDRQVHRLRGPVSKTAPRIQPLG